MAKIQKIFMLVVCSLLFASCGEELDPPLPYVAVDATFVLHSYPDLGMYGAVKHNQAGHGYNRNGLTLVRLGEKDFRAFDATCTRDLNHHNGSLSLDGSGYAVCPKCQTKYFLYRSGNAPIWSDDGKVRLQEYRATYNANTNLVRVTN